MERETVAVILTPAGAEHSKTVIIPLADAVAKYFELEAISESGSDITDDEERIFAALNLTFGTLNTTGAAQQLYDALKP